VIATIQIRRAVPLSNCLALSENEKQKYLLNAAGLVETGESKAAASVLWTWLSRELHQRLPKQIINE
jgi:hypothetical protein